MTKPSMNLAEPLGSHEDGDFLRAISEAVLQRIMETDVAGVIGAGRHERAEGRATWRDGCRERALDSRLGTLNLREPKLRQGSCFPGFLEPRRTSEKALAAVIEETWIGDASTRKVDDPVQAMGLSGISESTVSKLCKDIDERVGEFLRGLKARGLGGVKRVIPETHAGLKAAISRVVETPRQRRRVHRMRNALARVACGRLTVVAAAIRQAFSQPDRERTEAARRRVADQIRPPWPKRAALMDESEHDVLACMAFPARRRCMQVEAFSKTDAAEVDPILGITAEAA